MTVDYRVLMLVDGSERTIQTANYIKDFMPVGEKSRIVLFHVLSGLPEEYREMLQNPTCAKAEAVLKGRELQERGKVLETLEQAKKILIAGGFSEQSVEIKLHCREKSVAQDIIEEAKKGYTAVVLRRRGLGALKNIILGSVAVKLLQAVDFIPVILVGQAPSVKKILLAVDASPPSMKAVDFVGALLGGGGYAVGIFHAIVGLGAIRFCPTEGGSPPQSEAELPESCIEAFQFKVVQLFRAVKAKLLEAGFAADQITQKVLSGVHSRPEAIVAEAEAGGYGSIVVGRRGLSRVDAFFMGRVSHAVVYEGKKFTVWVV